MKIVRFFGGELYKFSQIVHYCAGLTELCGSAPTHPIRRPGMEFSVVNRRHPSHETPFGPGAKKDSCFRRLHIKFTAITSIDNHDVPYNPTKLTLMS